MLASQVLDQYFIAVQSHSEDKVLGVFADNATISTQERDLVGKDAIREFYRLGVLKCTSFEPKPGPYFLLGENAIAVEIRLMCDGAEKRVGDFFTFEGDKIIHLHVYSGRGYKESSPKAASDLDT